MPFIFIAHYQILSLIYYICKSYLIVRSELYKIKQNLHINQDLLIYKSHIYTHNTYVANIISAKIYVLQATILSLNA